jgi:tRNA-dihydrouridine synthase C
MQGYAPPVDWPLVGAVRKRAGIPVIANGDIWTLADFHRCREETGCSHFMLGRGVLADPAFARRVAMELGLLEKTDVLPNDWPALLKQWQEWSQHYGDVAPVRTVSRMKQWLRQAAIHGDFADFEAIKYARKPEELFEQLQR